MATVPAVTFSNDILPLFGRWKSYMIWRLDLTRYEDVKMNAEVIYDQIQSGNMPPPNIATLSAAEIALFKAWMDAGYPE